VRSHATLLVEVVAQGVLEAREREGEGGGKHEAGGHPSMLAAPVGRG
jgi:hypothetical protein